MTAVPTRSNTVPDVPITDVTANRGDLANNLMAWYNGKAAAEAVVLGVHVRVAHPTSFDLNQQFSGPR
jgi:hypothetical protein